ncbi:ribonuclease HII [bacterium]|nr:ribonuclease HII [bacterium]MBT5015669.1 ribonuclease HII [bacterium]
MAKKLTIENDILERDIWVNKGLLCGIDEVGRGCLAGPVIAAAVVLNPGKKSKYVRDSKLMTEQERLLAYKWIVRNSTFGIGIVDHRRIDALNIYAATQWAMKRAVSQLTAQLSKKPDLMVVDAMPLVFSGEEFTNIPVKSFPFAESRSISVAAASIVAKVTRDRIMGIIDKSIPGYNLDHHKGYGTQEHSRAVIEQGSSIIHRQSFLKKSYDKMVEYRYEKQRELFG